MKKIILLVDMDNVVCDYESAHLESIKKFPEMAYPQAQYKFFENLKPMPGAIDGIDFLRGHFKTFFLTRPSVKNPLNYTEKRIWIEENIDYEMCKNLILCYDKTMVRGDYLIDDNVHTGIYKPVWDHIHFGSDKFPGWTEIIEYFKKFI